MPFPFFAHQAAVLPFKLRFPRGLSGTGLAIGSLAPDLGYFLIGMSVTRDWHRPHGIFLYCLPVALVLWWLLTRVLAAPLARHLPGLGSFRLRDYAYLEAQPRTLAHVGVVALSIVIGAGTHLAWDLFTHEGTWMGDHIPWLDRVIFTAAGRRFLGTSVLWVGSTLVGGTFSLLVLLAIGRQRLLRRWAEERLPGSTAGIDPDAPAATSQLAFWAPVVLLTAAGVVEEVLTLPPGFGMRDKATWVLVFLRSASVGFLALLAVAWRERRAWRHPSSGHGSSGVSNGRAVDPAA